MMACRPVLNDSKPKLGFQNLRGQGNIGLDGEMLFAKLDFYRTLGRHRIATMCLSKVIYA